ncbi:MAG TPA: DUF6438 domain-containing protein, partial [Longimicrobiaceae bacterium]|nr:DUF6438 domain-containing protein [Longimicrobiaceae bacterium]
AGLLFGGCHRNRAEADAAPGSSSAADVDQPAVSLERTPCHGTCPVYTVSLYGDGRVAWHGERFVPATGDSTARVSPAAVQALVARARGLGFFAADSAYDYQTPHCGAYATDLPGTVIRVRADGRVHQVRHDYGCRGAPASLRQLAAAIDSVAGVARWRGAER